MKDDEVSIADQLRAAATRSADLCGREMLIIYRKQMLDDPNLEVEDRIGLIEAALCVHLAAFNGVLEAMGLLLGELPGQVADEIRTKLGLGFKTEKPAKA